MHVSLCPLKLCLLGLILPLLFSSPARAYEAQSDLANQSDAVSCQNLSFKNLSFYRLPQIPGSLVTADFNNDGITDVAAPMPDINRVAVLLGDKQGGFAPSREFVAGITVRSAVAGDFNRDGELDLAVTSSGDGQVNVLIGDGNGNFELNKSYGIGRTAEKIVASDFNNDGLRRQLTTSAKQRKRRQ